MCPELCGLLLPPTRFIPSPGDAVWKDRWQRLHSRLPVPLLCCAGLCSGTGQRDSAPQVRRLCQEPPRKGLMGERCLPTAWDLNTNWKSLLHPAEGTDLYSLLFVWAFILRCCLLFKQKHYHKRGNSLLKLGQDPRSLRKWLLATLRREPALEPTLPHQGCSMAPTPPPQHLALKTSRQCKL